MQMKDLQGNLLLDKDGKPRWEKVEYGEKGGEAYPIFTSGPFDLRDFGLGVAMYFQTLQILCATCLLCGLFQVTLALQS